LRFAPVDYGLVGAAFDERRPVVVRLEPEAKLRICRRPAAATVSMHIYQL